MVDEIIFSSSKIYLCHRKTFFFLNYLDSVLSGFVNSMRRPLVVSTITQHAKNGRWQHADIKTGWDSIGY